MSKIPLFEGGRLLLLSGIITIAFLGLISGIRQIKRILNKATPSKTLLTNTELLNKAAFLINRRFTAAAVVGGIAGGLIIALLFAFVNEKAGLSAGPMPAMTVSFLLGAFFVAAGGSFLSSISTSAAASAASLSARSREESDKGIIEFADGLIISVLSSVIFITGILVLILRNHAAVILCGFLAGTALTAFIKNAGKLILKADPPSVEGTDKNDVLTFEDFIPERIQLFPPLLTVTFSAVLISAILPAVTIHYSPSFKLLYGSGADNFSLNLILFPLVLAASGLLSTIISLKFSGKGLGNHKKEIWIFISSVSACLFVATILMFKGTAQGSYDWRFFLTALMGMTAASILRLTGFKGKTASGDFGEEVKRGIPGLAAIILSLILTLLLFKNFFEFQIYGFGILGISILTSEFGRIRRAAFESLGKTTRMLIKTSETIKPETAGENATRILMPGEIIQNTPREPGYNLMISSFLSALVIIGSVSRLSGLIPSSVEELKEAMAIIDANPNVIVKNMSAIGFQLNSPLAIIGVISSILILLLILSRLIHHKTKESAEKEKSAYTGRRSSAFRNALAISVLISSACIAALFGGGLNLGGAFTAGIIISCALLYLLITGSKNTGMAKGVERKKDLNLFMISDESLLLLASSTFLLATGLTALLSPLAVVTRGNPTLSGIIATAALIAGCYAYYKKY